MEKYQILASELISRLPNGNQRVFLTSNIPQFTRLICYNLVGIEIDEEGVKKLLIQIQPNDLENLPSIFPLANGLGYIIEIN